MKIATATANERNGTEGFFNGNYDQAIDVNGRSPSFLSLKVTDPVIDALQIILTSSEALKLSIELNMPREELSNQAGSLTRQISAFIDLLRGLPESN